MPKVEIARLTSDDWFIFHCPGCEGGHGVPVSGPKAWQWNGSLGDPTIKPSILINKGRSNPTAPQCHLFVTEGRLEYQADCTHGYAGKTIDMEEF